MRDTLTGDEFRSQYPELHNQVMHNICQGMARSGNLPKQQVVGAIWGGKVVEMGKFMAVEASIVIYNHKVLGGTAVTIVICDEQAEMQEWVANKHLDVQAQGMKPVACTMKESVRNLINSFIKPIYDDNSERKAIPPAVSR